MTTLSASTDVRPIYAQVTPSQHNYAQNTPRFGPVIAICQKSTYTDVMDAATNIDPKIFGVVLHNLRGRVFGPAKVTWAKISTATEISDRQLLRYRNGERPPTLDHYIALAKFFGMTTTQLTKLCEEESKSPTAKPKTRKIRGKSA